MNRGEIRWADVAEPRGSELAKRRPVVIVQEDSLTRSRLQTVMMVPITSNLKRAAAQATSSSRGVTQDSAWRASRSPVRC